MTKLPFIAEIHDIGKLVDKASPGLKGIKHTGHTFHNFDFSQLNISPPTSPSWWGQWSDSLKDIHATGSLPTGITEDGKACVVLTNIADILAASISRTWGKKKAVEEGVHLLWNSDFYRKAGEQGRKWAAFQNPNELKLFLLNEILIPALNNVAVLGGQKSLGGGRVIISLLMTWLRDSPAGTASIRWSTLSCTTTWRRPSDGKSSSRSGTGSGRSR